MLSSFLIFSPFSVLKFSFEMLILTLTHYMISIMYIKDIMDGWTIDVRIDGQIDRTLLIPLLIPFIKCKLKFIF